MKLFKRNRKNHWERVYRKSSPTEIGWYQAFPEMSLELIGNSGVSKDASIIDVGGGTSLLSLHLLNKGYTNLSVMDISGSAIQNAKSQLSILSSEIHWIEADVTQHHLSEKYNIWHDRAVFHFLTKEEDRKGYISTLNQALKPHNHLIIATFGLNAPPKCSGLPVVRYCPDTLHNELGSNFHLAEHQTENHITPSGIKQEFIYCRFVKRT